MQIQTGHNTRIRTAAGSSIHAGGSAIRFGKGLMFGTVHKSSEITENFRNGLYGETYETDSLVQPDKTNGAAGNTTGAVELGQALTEDGRRIYKSLNSRDKRKYERYYKRKMSEPINAPALPNKADINKPASMIKGRASQTAKDGVQAAVKSTGKTVATTAKTTAKTVAGVAAGAVTFGAGTAVMAATDAVVKTTKAAAQTAKKVTDRMQEQTAQSIQQENEAKAQENMTVAKADESRKDSSNSSSVLMLLVALAAVVMIVFTSGVCIGNTIMQSQTGQDGGNGTACTQIAQAAEEELTDADFTVGGYRYKSWYGMDDNWCAMFVSYCANKCGFIDSGIMPKTASVAAMKQWYINRGLFQYSSSGYQPKAGDIIIFGNGMSHTGIVTGYDSSTQTVTTIEGNSGRSSTSPYHKGSHVKEHHYRLSYPKIVGYGTPEYPQDGENQLTEQKDEMEGNR